MIDFTTLQGLTIPEGVVTQITDASGNVIWAVQSGEPIVLEVKKITADTYEGETTYTGESFILLDIYPKTASSKVKVTYGGLTKTLTFFGTNAQPVFFGTFNGVSDSVETPVRGTLTIEGGCRGVAIGTYRYYASSANKAMTSYCSCITSVTDLGSVTTIPADAFRQCDNISSLFIPETVSSIGVGSYGVFYGCKALAKIEVDGENAYYSADGKALFDKGKTVLIAYAHVGGDYTVPNGVIEIATDAFYEISNATITIPASVVSIGSGAFYASTGGVQVNVVMLATIPPQIGTDAFNTSKISESRYHNNIIVPKGCGEAYKAAEGWSKYADQITEAT